MQCKDLSLEYHCMSASEVRYFTNSVKDVIMEY